ncbi:MAG: phosphoglycerate dehydrogenase [Opitutae bacterium]|nr:phosphoglycerate dehydrogenase [Opitutae bacterium]MBC9888871.1 phosphoglycerate dehydrogenase [Opitutae bacterium]
MRIVVADRIAASGVEYLQKQDDFEVVEAYGSSPEEVLQLARDASAFIVRSETRITAEVIEAAPKLKVVGRAGVGVDNIDLEAASQKGVVVMNAPGGNTIATSELTFTHILCGARQIAQANASMRSGKWDRKLFSGVEVFHKTLGILGLGRIGSEVASRALAFGMRILAHDPYLAPARAEEMGVELRDLDTVFSEADFITVHMPLTEGTRNLIDKDAFARMRDGVRIFNCARGGIINQKDLVEAIQSGKVAYAGLDVYEEEPLPGNSELRGIPHLVLTPHLGASTREAQESVGLEIAQSLAEALRGGVILNALNMPSVDRKTLQALGPYFRLGENLGNFLQQIAPDQVKKLRITYYGKFVDLDANPLTRTILKGYLKNISGDTVNSVNAPILLQQLGVENEVVKSNEARDYHELILLEAETGDGGRYSVEGTVIGKAGLPRIVNINGREVEAPPEGIMIVVENHDVPGIVGTIGTILGRDGVNIAAMSLSRNRLGGLALNVVNLDSRPSEKAFQSIISSDSIESALVVVL